MKKNLWIYLLTLAFAICLVGCSVSEDTTIEFAERPNATYVLTETNYDTFMTSVKVKVGDGSAEKEYTLKDIIALEGVTVTLDGVAISAEKWVAGQHQLVVKYDTVSVNFQFTINASGDPDGGKTNEKDPSYTWYSTTATEYEVKTIGELIGLANIVNGTAEGITQFDFTGKTVKLGADINLTDVTWSPIGQGPRKYSSEVTARSLEGQKGVFRGTFDGMNYTITGLSNAGYQPTIVDDNSYANSSKSMVVRGYTFGLFGRVENATFKNLTMLKVSIDTEMAFGSKTYTGDSVAALVGYAGDACVFENITVGKADALCTISGFDAVGGICGRNYNNDSVNAKTTKFTNCKVYANLSVSRASGGKGAGLLGYASNGTSLEKDAKGNAISGKPLTIEISNSLYKGTVTCSLTTNLLKENNGNGLVYNGAVANTTLTGTNTDESTVVKK